MDPENKFGRRDFIKTAAGLVAGLIGGALGLPAIAYVLSPSFRRDDQAAWVDIGPLDGYPLEEPRFAQFTRARENGWERTAMSYGVFVVRQSDTSVRVLSNICTHLGCRVGWHPDIQNYVSPCHDGHFDVLGNVVSGPPPRPLDEFISRIEDGRLYIQLPAIKRAS